jgi:hypothetical protein
MTDVLEENLILSETMLQEAARALEELRYGDAEASARMALDGFLLTEEDTRFSDRTFRGIQEAGRIVIRARQLWTESGQTPSVAVVDLLRAQLRKEVDSLDRDFRLAARSAITGLPNSQASVTK